MLIVLLNNPGRAYLKTRHNVPLKWENKLNPFQHTYQNKFKGQYTKTMIGGRSHHLLIPQTFMNKSGESVKAAASFFNCLENEILILHDDLELPLGQYKLKRGGGNGGHNGLKSVSQILGTNNFWRMRIGIGRPQHGSVHSFVLGKFTQDEEITLSQIEDAVLEEIIKCIQMV